MAEQSAQAPLSPEERDEVDAEADVSIQAFIRAIEGGRAGPTDAEELESVKAFTALEARQRSSSNAVAAMQRELDTSPRSTPSRHTSQSPIAGILARSPTNTSPSEVRRLKAQIAMLQSKLSDCILAKRVVSDDFERAEHIRSDCVDEVGLLEVELVLMASHFTDLAMQHSELQESYGSTYAKVEALEELCDELEAECHFYREREANEKEATDRMSELVQQSASSPVALQDPADARFEKRWAAAEKAVKKWTKKAQDAQSTVAAKDSLLADHAAALLEKDRLIASQEERIKSLENDLENLRKQAGENRNGKKNNRNNVQKDKGVQGKAAKDKTSGATTTEAKDKTVVPEGVGAKKRRGEDAGKKGEDGVEPKVPSEKEPVYGANSQKGTDAKPSKKDRKKSKADPPKTASTPLAASPPPGRAFHVSGDGWVLDEDAKLPPTTPERAPSATEKKHRVLLGDDGSPIELRVWEDTGELFLTIVHRGSKAVSSVIFPWALWAHLHGLIQACLDQPQVPQSHVLTAGVRSFTFQYTPQAQIAVAELQPRRLTPVVVTYALCGPLAGHIGEFRAMHSVPHPLSPQHTMATFEPQQLHQPYQRQQPVNEGRAKGRHRPGLAGSRSELPRDKKPPREKKEKSEAEELAKKPCFRCRQKGHRAKDCPMAKTCYNCGGEGHIGSECPLPRAMRCVICQQPDHRAKDCPQAQNSKAAVCLPVV